jgi:putative transposase
LKTTFQYRLYPTNDQQSELSQMFGAARYTWNFMLGVRQEAYAHGGVSLNYYDCANALPTLKGSQKFLADAPAQALQMVCRNLDRAFKSFFDGTSKYPAFKKKHGAQSLQFPQGASVGEECVRLPKLGKIPAVIHRPLVGQIKTVTLSKRPSCKYFVSVSVDDGCLEPEKEVAESSGIIGVDLGVKDLATFSDGTRIANPKFFKRTRKRIARLSRNLSRHKKGSHRREKARIRLAKVRERESNQRKDFLHKITSHLVDENQVVAIEDLNVKGMQKNPRLAGSIWEASFGEIRRQFEYKAARRGKTIFVVGRFFPSSKQCNHCKRINQSLKLSDRFCQCDCGELVDRDWNAALNLRDEAIKTLLRREPSELTLAESTASKEAQ